MTTSDPAKLTIHERRTGLRLANWQAALWGMGNGLTTGAFLQYLINDLDPGGYWLGFIIAGPALMGLARFFAPGLIALCSGNLKQFALATSVSSYLALSVAVIAGFIPETWLEASHLRAIEVVGVAILTHQLFESLSFVALWSWLGLLAPTPIRGRYLAQRQRWQLAFIIPTLFLGGLIATSSSLVKLGVIEHEWSDKTSQWWVFSLGLIFLWLALVPLAMMPGLRTISVSSPSGIAKSFRPYLFNLRLWLFASWANLFRTIAKPFSDGPFLRLLLASCWLSISTGVTQTVQVRYPINVLKISLFQMACFLALMRLGQFALSGSVGRFCDRFGNRPVLVLSQWFTACGLLFFPLASPEHPYLLMGAWICWAAFVGANIGLYNLLLKLAPPNLSTAYVAVYGICTALCFAGATQLGYYAFFLLRYGEFYVMGHIVSDYSYFFLVGWVLRLVGIVFLMGLLEPGAWTWLQIWRGTQQSQAVQALVAEAHPLD